MTEGCFFQFREAAQLFEDETIDFEVINTLGPESKRLLAFAQKNIPIPHLIAITKNAFLKIDEDLKLFPPPTAPPPTEEQEPKEGNENEAEKQDEVPPNAEGEVGAEAAKEGSYSGSTDDTATFPESTENLPEGSVEKTVPAEVTRETFLSILAADLITILNKFGEKGGLIFGDAAKPLSITITEDKGKESISIKGIGLNEANAKVLVDKGGSQKLLYEIIGNFNDKILNTTRSSLLVVETDSEAPVDFAELFSKFREEGEVVDDPVQQLSKSIDYFYQIYKTLPDEFTNLLVSFDPFVSLENFGFGVAKSRNVETGGAGINGFFSMGVSRAGLPDAEPENIKKLGPENNQLLTDIAKKFELIEKLPQEIEFEVQFSDIGVIEKRSIQITEYQASLRLAIDFARKKITSCDIPLKLFDYEKAKNTLNSEFDENELNSAQEKLLGEGTSVSPFVSSGILTFSLATLKTPLEEEDTGYIYVGKGFKVEDLELLSELKGIIIFEETVHSDLIAFSHYLKIPIITNLKKVKFSVKNKTISANDQELTEGDSISIDGTTGRIFACSIPINQITFQSIPDISQLISWSDDYRRQHNFQVLVSIDSTDELDLTAIGADGIGLYRVEQGFLAERTSIIQRLFTETNPEEKATAITEAEEAFQTEFSSVLELAQSNPCYVRLFDAPIDLFIPDIKELEDEIRKKTEEEDQEANEEEESHEKENLLAKIKVLTQTNSLLSCRGIRLSEIIPNFLEIQLKAFLEAAYQVAESLGEEANPDFTVLIPYVASEKEVEKVKATIEKLSIPIIKEHEIKVVVKVGAMIELPRACLVADKIAQFLIH